MTDPATTPLRLTDAQRRHLEVSLGHILGEIEEAVVWFDRWPLPSRLHERALRDLAGIESLVRSMASRLGLSPSPLRPDPFHKLEALKGHWWSSALDCRSQVLRGYGELDPFTGPSLDPLVEELAAALLRVGQPVGQAVLPEPSPHPESSTPHDP